MSKEDVLTEDNCLYKQLGDLWMCQFCTDRCSFAGKIFEEEEND